MSEALPERRRVPFADALRVWAKIGLLSFGGPAGQIALMHKVLVEERRWISEARFLHALNYCMLLPGPEATQLATYVGWLLHRTAGGVAAGLLFVLPGVVTIFFLSLLYVSFKDLTVVAGIFQGVKPAIVVVVLEALIRVGKRGLVGYERKLIALLAFVGIFFLGAPFPLIVLCAGLLGAMIEHRRPGRLTGATGLSSDGAHSPALLDDMLTSGELSHTAPSARRAVRVLGVCGVLWIAPIAMLARVLGPDHVTVREGIFFSKAAVVTFGGAYAVLAYVAEEAVRTFHWLGAAEMLDGLGLAETTPGPLIMVVQFVGFLGAFKHPGSLSPYVAGVIGSAITTWVTFVPCFLWIFLGAPWIESLRNRPGLGAALGGITAAVVGVILNLSLWFAIHVLFSEVHEARLGPLRLLIPTLSRAEPFAIVVALGAALLMLRFRVGMLPVLGLCAGAGLARALLS